MNCLNLTYTTTFFENEKYIELYGNKIEKTTEDFFVKYFPNTDIINDLETVARTVICNFQLYDFYIDFLDLRYLSAKEKELRLGEIYIKTESWLQQLQNDLVKQNSVYFKNNQLLISIRNVIAFLNKLIESVKEDKINLAEVAMTKKRRKKRN